MSKNSAAKNNSQYDPDQFLRTRILKDYDAPLARDRQTGPLDYGLGAPWVVELTIHGTPMTVRMEVKNRIIVGRSDVNDNLFPDLDLTPYGGLQQGVSRQHAAIIAETDRLLIIDLESTNGTFVNGERLQANKPFRLRHGDEVHIGKIGIDVRLEIIPKHEAIFRGQPWVHLPEKVRTAEGQHILIIEDNLEVAETLKSYLNSTGYEVQIVRTVDAAYEAVSQVIPNAVIVNLELDEINGLAFCRHVQRLPNNTRVPVIVLSEKADSDYVGAVMAAGLDVFLGKPVGMDELVRVIASVTQSHLADSKL